MNKLWYAFWIIVPTSIIRIVTYGVVSLYVVGNMIGSILYVYALSLLASLVTKRCMKNSNHKKRDIVNIIAGYVAYVILLYISYLL